MQIVSVTERGGGMILLGSLISLVSAILGGILGHFLHRHSVHSMERKRIIEEFQEIKNYTATYNEWTG